MTRSVALCGQRAAQFLNRRIAHLLQQVENHMRLLLDPPGA
ncbi:hypothetical protein [Acidiphilium sp.]|nr:hypothetical protein [Acidiphilium sp.]